jgi:hypothetical protein
MEHQGSSDELLANWSLAPGDMALLDGLAAPGRIGLDIQLAFWRRHNRFPDDDADVAPVVIALTPQPLPCKVFSHESRFRSQTV